MANNRTNKTMLDMTDEEFDEHIGLHDEPVRQRPVRHGAKKGKGKKVALTLLVLGGMVAGTIFGTRAFYSHQETRRVDSLINHYTINENYVAMPDRIITDRTYDVTYAEGTKVVDRLNKKNIEYARIDGQFFTKEGINIVILTYDVTREERTPSIVEKNDGATFYMPPMEYELPENGTEKASNSIRYVTERRTVVLPADTDIECVSFTGAYKCELVSDPVYVETLPFDAIKEYTLICDVADNATLDENNECSADLNLAPKKH